MQMLLEDNSAVMCQFTTVFHICHFRTVM